MKRTTATDPFVLGWLEHQHRSKNINRLPENEYEALMETLPHEEPLPVSGFLNSFISEPVTNMINELSDYEKDILYALFYQGLSLRKAGKELNIPKTTLARRRDELYKKVEQKLEADPAIQKSFKEKTERNKKNNVINSRSNVNYGDDHTSATYHYTAERKKFFR